MEHVNVGARDDEWTVLASTSRSQAAMMTIEPGGKVVRIGPGSLLLVEAGERHEIENDGTEPLKTINVYAPPEYDS